jgi:hypothetical protein
MVLFLGNEPDILNGRYIETTGVLKDALFMLFMVHVVQRSILVTLKEGEASKTNTLVVQHLVALRTTQISTPAAQERLDLNGLKTTVDAHLR